MKWSRIFFIWLISFFLWGFTFVNKQQNTQLEIPSISTDEILTIHSGYTTSYNHQYHIPNWVAYELHPSELNGINERSDKFLPDPLIKPATCNSSDYTKSGYDRGHLAPAGDMTWSESAMKESFYMSNICPQSPPLNRGIWKDLESAIRDYVKFKQHPLFIITGPVISKNNAQFKNWLYGSIGKTHRVAVPNFFFKAVLDTVGIDKSVAYIIPNSPPQVTFQSYKSMHGGHANFRITVDSLERVLNRNLFPRISSKLGNSESPNKTVNPKNKAESKVGLILD